MVMAVVVGSTVVGLRRLTVEREQAETTLVTIHQQANEAVKRWHAAEARLDAAEVEITRAHDERDKYKREADAEIEKARAAWQEVTAARGRDEQERKKQDAQRRAAEANQMLDVLELRLGSSFVQGAAVTASRERDSWYASYNDEKKLREKVEGERDRDATITQLQGLCAAVTTPAADAGAD